MARYEFRLPDIGEGIAEAEIVTWHVKPGDRVSEDQPLADMMTDKATVEMESPVNGVVVEVAGVEGDMVPIGSTLVVIEVEGEEGEDSPAPVVTIAAPVSAPQADILAGTDLEAPMPFVPAPHPDAVPIAVPAPSPQSLASPAVRARAKELGVDLSQVQAREGGRIRHSDLDAFLSYSAAQGYTGASPARVDETIKVIGMRRRIAENMAASKRHIPHFTYVEEIDVTRLEDMRAELNSGRGDRPKLTMLPLMVVAICKALPDFPMINARYDDEAGVVTRHGAVHLGMATQTDAGLMVPVIRDAQTRNVWQLARQSRTSYRARR